MPAIQLMTVSSTETKPSAESAGVKSQKLSGLQGTFSNYMRQNSPNTAAQTAKGDSGMLQTKQPGNDTSVKQQYEQYQSRSQTAADKVTDYADGERVATGAVQETVEEAVENIKESIKENLGVDEEQLEAAMELLGLTQADLLDPQQLIALAVELTGSEDAAGMLFQENFQLVMQEAGAITDDLLQQLGMSMEELMDQVHTMLEDAQQPQNQEIETMLPQQEGQTDVPVQQTVQPQQEGTVPEMVQQTGPQPVEEAVQTVQQTRPQQEETQTSTETVVSPQEQPEETKQVQQTAPQQEETQTGEQTSAQPQQESTMAKSEESGDQPRFEFQTNVHAQHQTAHVQTPAAPASAPLPQVNMQEVIDQIVQHTRVHLSTDVKSIEMQLNPENLGKVYVHVSEKQGAVTAQLTAQNENVKEALVQQAAVLKETLNQQGIKVDAVEVSTGTHEFESGLERDAHSQEEQARQQEEQSMRRSTRSINLNDLNDLEGMSGLMSEEETLVAQMMRDNGNNVDYKA